MRYRMLGASGLRVSEFSLGMMTMMGANSDERRKIFRTFVESGGNFFDTANAYGAGASEKLLGELIAGERERFVVQTKYTLHMGHQGDPNAAGNQRKNMVQSLEASLKRLGTDYVDLYLVHAWDFLTPVEEVMRALDDMVRAGKVLYVGISDAPAWIVAQANTLAQQYGWSPFIEVSLRYNLLDRSAERELLPMAEALGIGVTAWSPLAHGVLSRKYVLEQQSRGASGGGFADPSARTRAILQKVQQIAKETGYTLSQVALAWIRVQAPIMIPIIAASTEAQIRENIASLNLSFADEQVHLLEEASRIPLDFPLGFLAKATDGIYGGMFDRIDSDRRNALQKVIQYER